MLVDRPRKLIVQFPGFKRHHKAEERDDTGNCQQIRSDYGPDRVIGVDVVRNQAVDGFFNLIILNGSVDEHTKVVQA